MLRHPSLLAAAALASLGSAAAPAVAARSAASGGTATFAQSVGAPPTYIFPLLDGANSGNNNLTYTVPLMWRPLYWFGHTNSIQPTINYRLSIGRPPSFTNGGRTVTIGLRRYRWSDGRPVTSRDVTFWINLIRANKADWCCYSPGDWIDRLVSARAPSADTVVLTFDRAYNRNWLIGNGLSQITPIPQSVWDRTSAPAPVGNYDETTHGAVAVYNFLNAQSNQRTTWDTNPLWQTVDGPWRLEPGSGFDATTGLMVLVPNPRYAGPDRPRLAKIEEIPFTSDAAEFDALISGQLDYGYLPFTDTALRQELLSRGFKVKPWLFWGFTFIEPNYANRQAGPILRQLYVRQAMQHLIDEPSYIRNVFKGYGWPTYGPVPVQPANPYASSFERSNPYLFSVADALALLRDHGWQITPGGVSACARPGGGARACGAGIARGAQLSFSLLYQSGVPSVTQEMEALQSSFSRVGLRLGLRQAPYSYLLSATGSCDPKTGANCSWQLASWGPPSITYVPVYYPTGGTIFGIGAPINTGHYASATADRLIAASHVQPGLAALTRYQDYIAAQLPDLWMPNSDYQISVISPHLRGVTAQDPTGHIYPETWSLVNS